MVPSRDDNFVAVIVFALAGLDLSLWVVGKPWFSRLMDAVVPFL